MKNVRSLTILVLNFCTWHKMFKAKSLCLLKKLFVQIKSSKCVKNKTSLLKNSELSITYQIIYTSRVIGANQSNHPSPSQIPLTVCWQKCLYWYKSRRRKKKSNIYFFINRAQNKYILWFCILCARALERTVKKFMHDQVCRGIQWKQDTQYIY